MAFNTLMIHSIKPILPAFGSKKPLLTKNTPDKAHQLPQSHINARKLVQGVAARAKQTNSLLKVLNHAANAAYLPASFRKVFSNLHQAVLRKYF
ncbi:MAG: hypothetical protein VKJ06_03350 [Vampirovibrionales bacterium]|nr:hypothetical protein [Vampirovibrionales bacterium]